MTPGSEREYLAFTVFSWTYATGLAGSFAVGYLVSVTMLKTFVRSVCVMVASLILLIVAIFALQNGFTFWIRLGVDIFGAFTLAILANCVTLLRRKKHS